MANSDPKALVTLRRVVTTHDSAGKSTIQIDNELVMKEGVSPATFAGALWVTTDALPTNDNNNNEDGGTRAIEDEKNFHLVHPSGTNFRITELAPGASVPMHRTSSLDYNILLAGELVHITEDGQEKHLKNPGDTVIQKGTLHAWKNPSSENWCRWAAVLVAAEPALVNGTPLAPEFQL